MKSKSIALIAFLSVFFLCCSQDKIVELPLTIQNGFNPFGMSMMIVDPVSENENDPWRNAWPKISKFPEGLPFNPE